MTTARRWRGSSGGSAPGRPGVPCRSRSGRISPCGNGIGCGRPMAPTGGCSRRCASSRSWTTTRWRRYCRSTPRSCGLTNTQPAHAATRSSRPLRTTQGAGSNYTNSRVVPGEPPDHALGRSRGGLSTKIHALADQTCTPVIAALTGGQAGDNPMLSTLLVALAEFGGIGCRARRLLYRLMVFRLFATLPTFASSTTVGSSRPQESLTGIPQIPSPPPSFTAARMLRRT